MLRPLLRKEFFREDIFLGLLLFVRKTTTNVKKILHESYGRAVKKKISFRNNISTGEIGWGACGDIHTNVMQVAPRRGVYIRRLLFTSAVEGGPWPRLRWSPDQIPHSRAVCNRLVSRSVLRCASGMDSGLSSL